MASDEKIAELAIVIEEMTSNIMALNLRIDGLQDDLLNERLTRDTRERALQSRLTEMQDKIERIP